LFWRDLEAILAPKTDPKRSQNRPKIEAKINQFFDGFRDRFLEEFWWIFGAKTEPSWSQNGVKNRYQLRRAIFQKNLEKPMKNQ